MQRQRASHHKGIASTGLLCHRSCFGNSVARQHAVRVCGAPVQPEELRPTNLNLQNPFPHPLIPHWQPYSRLATLSNDRTPPLDVITAAFLPLTTASHPALAGYFSIPPEPLPDPSLQPAQPDGQWCAGVPAGWGGCPTGDSPQYQLNLFLWHWCWRVCHRVLCLSGVGKWAVPVHHRPGELCSQWGDRLHHLNGGSGWAVL